MEQKELDERSVDWWAHHNLASFWDMVKDSPEDDDYKDHKDPANKQHWIDYIQCEQDQVEEGHALTESQIEQVYQHMLTIEWGENLALWSQLRFAEVDAHMNLVLSASDFRHVIDWLKSGNAAYLEENYLISVRDKVLLAYSPYLKVCGTSESFRAIMHEMIDYFGLAIPKV